MLSWRIGRVTVTRVVEIEFNTRYRADAPFIPEATPQALKATPWLYPDFVRFLFEDVVPPADADPEVCAAAAEKLKTVEPWTAPALEAALRAFADKLGQKPRQAFQPIRLAVTGSKISPGLFESLELLGRDESIRRLVAVQGR